MNQFIAFLICTFSMVNLNAQTFLDPSHLPGNCERDVNDGLVPGFRTDIKRATFTYDITFGSDQYSCTGTLINRNTQENTLGQFFITSWHCFKSGTVCGGSTYDFNTPITLTFNYQSPPDHLGKVFYPNQNGTQYKITRNIRLVDHVDCGYGDVAICEILGDPIPPHFNPYFAGWVPNSPPQVGSFITMGHPNQSTKQAAATDYVQNGVTANPLNNPCKIITKVIDVLVGWVWGHQYSTQVICDYVQIPFIDTRYVVFGWNYGTTAEGQSGSGIFEGNNRLFGNLSGGPGTSCSADHCFFGKLPDYYYRGAIKNMFNPLNKWSIDESGIPGRNRNCYDKIDYNYNTNPNAAQPQYTFYPASYYQADNAILLNSHSYINIGSNSINQVRIVSGSNFTLNAETSIDIGPFCDIETGVTFAANPNIPCSYSGSYRMSSGNEPSSYEAEAKRELYSRINKIQIPEHMELSESFTKKKMVLSIHPNPAYETVQVDFISIPKGNVDIIIYDILGREVMKESFNQNGQRGTSLFIGSLQTGIYQIVFVAGEQRVVEKLVVQK